MNNRNISQFTSGVITSFIIVFFTAIPYFYFVLHVIQRVKKFTFPEFHEFASFYGPLIILPISYVVLMGGINYFIYRSKNSEIFFFSFIVSAILLTGFAYRVFYSWIWF